MSSDDHFPLSLRLDKFGKLTPTFTDKAKNLTLINFVYKDDIYGKDGIIEAAGDSVKQEYDQKRIPAGWHISNHLIETAGGKLPISTIFHVMVSPHPKTFEATMRTALQLACSK